MIREGFISPPYGSGWPYNGPGVARPTWEVYAAVEWAVSCASPPMVIVAACSSREAAIAAARLLGISLDGPSEEQRAAVPRGHCGLCHRCGGPTEGGRPECIECTMMKFPGPKRNTCPGCGVPYAKTNKPR